ncbi:hypothetical protein [Paraburkholderia sp.]|jgi:hypothetical protein|uniref:hypothetical protein n=1 Tax=Paraburkholderia sp. TaxID=1926495 RepID=UPI002F41DCA2
MSERKSGFDDLGAALEHGIADSDAGRGKPARNVFDRLEEKYLTMAKVEGLVGPTRRAVISPNANGTNVRTWNRDPNDAD